MKILPIDGGDAATIEAGARVIRESYAQEAVLLGLTEESFPAHPAFCGGQWLTTTLAARNARVFGAYEEDGEMVGLLLLRALPKGQLETLRLCVVPQARAGGYGVRLHEHALFCARALRCGIMVATTADSADASRWCLRAGYEKKGSLSMAGLPYKLAFWEQPI